ncbi:uncharacterized protein LOC143301298 [Babylonia areolata]|uniref:uncharacterized protein LOC143301298 n=1 Tax=Babylonia areolata TaxID=304850 RepID=UPI003FD4A3F6
MSRTTTLMKVTKVFPVVVCWCIVLGPLPCPSWGGVTTLSALRLVLERKIAEGACQEVNETTDVSCTRMPNTTASCRGFSLTCSDLDPGVGADLGSSCQCVSCFTQSSVQVPGSPSRNSEATTVPAGSTAVPAQTTTVPEEMTTVPEIVAPHCSSPPSIERTSVAHSVTSTHDVARYSCSVSGDVYVSGTTEVTCSPAGGWPTATIACAPTNCWYWHPTEGPLYAGTLAVTQDGHDCQIWADNYPQEKNADYEPDSMYPSDGNSKVAARNYCRIFDDGYSAVWCYWNETSGMVRKYSDCDVPQC